MDEITVLDMAQELGISSAAVKMRLSRKGVEPFKYIGSAGIYRKSALDAIREGGTRGRPKAPKPRGAAAKAKTKKPKKS
jgi:predicted transcriptional regulator